MNLKQDILQRLPTIPEDTLLMSRKNCHGKGLHSIVLHKTTDGRLFRMFVTDNSHKMWQNTPDNHNYSLGVHDHKYDIYLQKVFGNVLNMNYAEVSSPLLPDEVCKYKFTSHMDGCGKIELVEKEAYLAPTGLTLLSDDPLHLTHDVLHTVFVPKGDVCAWTVMEGNTVKDNTRLYTNSDINLDNCYETFKSNQEVVDFVSNLFKQED